MLSATQLQHGLDAMSRASEGDYFADGHRGGAVISAYYLCRDLGVEDGVARMLDERLQDQWLSTPLFAPAPDEPADAGLIDRIVTTMVAHIDGVRQAGHDVILPTLALKAFHDVPDAVTPTRVEGICRLIAAFQHSDLPLADPVDLPPGDDPRTFARSVLEEFVRCTERFTGRGQGWSGHLLTFAAALADLQDLGHDALHRRALESFHLYVRRVRLGPLDGDVPRPEHSTLRWLPRERAYWEHKDGGDWQLGHVLKYPYGYYRLLTLARDPALEERCRAVAFRIF